jgi:hypothetical protein
MGMSVKISIKCGDKHIEVESDEPIDVVLGALWKYENSGPVVNTVAPTPKVQKIVALDGDNKELSVGDRVQVIAALDFVDRYGYEFLEGPDRGEHPAANVGVTVPMNQLLGNYGRIVRIEPDAVTVGFPRGKHIPEQYWPAELLFKQED